MNNPTKPILVDIRAIGRKGGQSRSKAKLAAVMNNLRLTPNWKPKPCSSPAHPRSASSHTSRQN